MKSSLKIIIVIILLGCSSFGFTATHIDLIESIKQNQTNNTLSLIVSQKTAFDHDENNSSALMWAAIMRQKDIAQTLLEKGARLDIEDNIGDTPLIAAAKGGNVEIIKLFLKAGADPFILNLDGESALTTAINYNNFAVAEFLINSIGSDKQSIREYNRALLTSAQTNNPGLAEKLLLKKAEPSSIDKQGYSVLFYAVKHNEFDLVKQLLIISTSDINKPFPKGMSPLMLAAGNGYTELSDFLIKQGAKIEAKDNFDRTALMYAVRYGHFSIVDNLLKRGAKLNSQNKQGLTALMLAASIGQRTSFNLLIQHKPNLSLVDEQGRTALFHSVDAGQTEMVQVLIKSGSNLNHSDRFGESALMKAAYNGFYQISKSLIKSGANVNSKNISGSTALMFAVVAGKIHIVKLMMEKNANVNASDAIKQTALIFAASRGYEKIVSILLQNHADINLQDNNLKTALAYARAKKASRIIEMLNPT